MLKPSYTFHSPVNLSLISNANVYGLVDSSPLLTCESVLHLSEHKKADLCLPFLAAQPPVTLEGRGL